MRVYVSGLHSGANPSPGVGTARSIREGYPDAEIIGVDYSTRCSGLHWDGFDDIWLQESWDRIDLDQYAEQVRAILDEGGIWISGMDIEAEWLSRNIGPHPNLLVPPTTTLEQIHKPVRAVGEKYGLLIPPTIRLDEPDWKIHEFCRRNDWEVWMKGPNYEAKLVTNWQSFFKARDYLAHTWSTIDDLLLQAHIAGVEECIAISAHEGRLLDAVYMVKRDVTRENKTWAGKISPLNDDLRALVERIVRDLNWTGGAEMEFVRDLQGRLWLIEMNPRFPAWIHGATLAGHNLPGLLVQATTDTPMNPTKFQNNEFVRVVFEIPARAEYGLPPLQISHISEKSAGLKHPSGMPFLSRRLRGVKKKIPRAPTPHDGQIPQQLLKAIEQLNVETLETPATVLLDSQLEGNIAALIDGLDSARAEGLDFVVAYSIKTDPNSQIMRVMRRHGFYAEAISQLEVKQALSCGFEPSKIVLNGPGMWWPQLETDEPLHAIMCDTIYQLEEIVEGRNPDHPSAEFVGIRIHPPGLNSRFGVTVGDYSQFNRLVEVVRKIPDDQKFGVHLHISSSMIGVRRWQHMFKSLLLWAGSLERLSGTKIHGVDLGGGWFPDDFFEIFLKDLPASVSQIRGMLPNVTEISIEPGKALVQSAVCVVARVINVRESEYYTDIIVDASIADLPQVQIFPHRVLLKTSDGELKNARNGNWRITGRLCMEVDILVNGISFDVIPRVGDWIVFLDAGAYDRSMAYDFGKG